MCRIVSIFSNRVRYLINQAYRIFPDSPKRYSDLGSVSVMVFLGLSRQIPGQCVEVDNLDYSKSLIRHDYRQIC
jgi:hypothetical protein